MTNLTATFTAGRHILIDGVPHEVCAMYQDSSAFVALDGWGRIVVVRSKNSRWMVGTAAVSVEPISGNDVDALLSKARSAMANVGLWPAPWAQ